MAVYTDVAADELAEFLARYDLGELLSYKGIAEGVENSNFLLHTTRGSFILTLYEKRVAKDDLPFFLGLMAHLAAHGINCPQPVKNRQRRGARHAGRPAGGDHHLSRRHVAAQAERRALRRRRRGAGEDASGRARFSDDARQRAVGRGLAAAVRCRAARAPTRCSTGLRDVHRAPSSIISKAASGRRTCRKA